MKVKINTNISDEVNKDEIEITIKASENSVILNKIIENIQSVSENIDTLIGSKDNNIFIINIQDTICFYSKDQSNYCKTQNGEFRIKKKLYELEESLDKKVFIRISNSCIVNIKFVESFDLSRIGNIIVKFLDGSIKHVSKRRISSVMKFLRERGN